MSLKPTPSHPLPADTVRVARAAFPHGTPYLTLRDQLGTIFQDEQFADLYPSKGQPGFPPWRLALVTLLQFRENLADRQAAEAVRARIDWKYVLGLELTDPGFDFSVLSEFRARLLAGKAEALLLDTLLEGCRALGLLKARGHQRTDATHILASIRVLHRLELVAETLRAALNEVATVAPEWTRALAPAEWFERYSRRIEDATLPKGKAERERYLHTVGVDGLRLLDALDTLKHEPLQKLAKVAALRRTWQRHYERLPEHDGKPGVRLRTPQELPRAAEGIESPYDTEARYRTKGDTTWVGYMVHISETCEEDSVNLITHTHTTTATVHEAMCTAPIQQALLDKELPPHTHLVDAAYVSADLLVTSREDQGITLLGPPRPDPNWQAKVEGAYSVDKFTIDWNHQKVHCPQGKTSTTWTEHVNAARPPYIHVSFRQQECQACAQRSLCTRAKPPRPRTMSLQPQRQYEALQATRASYAREAGRHLYARRSGIEGTLSQGVRTVGLRQTRYRGLAKTHLQHVATAAAINVDRLVAWFDGRPRASTRTSRFAALAPEYLPKPWAKAD